MAEPSEEPRWRTAKDCEDYQRRLNRSRNTTMAEPIECRSEIGVTIGLIDSIINTARLLRARIDLDALVCGETGDELQPIREALRDLQDCQEFEGLITFGDRRAMKIIHDAVDLLEADND